MFTLVLGKGSITGKYHRGMVVQFGDLGVAIDWLVANYPKDFDYVRNDRSYFHAQLEFIPRSQLVLSDTCGKVIAILYKGNHEDLCNITPDEIINNTCKYHEDSVVLY